MFAKVEAVAKNGLSRDVLLNKVLGYAATMRATRISEEMIARYGPVVWSGPFKGMTFVGGIAPRLIGCYESELHSAVESLVAERFDSIVNIGCGQGYYAIGFARRVCAAKIYAYDIDPVALETCKRLARENGVSDRITFGGAFAGQDFQSFAAEKTLVFCDIEGAEDALLDPRKYSGLVNSSVVVECHDGLNPGVSERLRERFGPTHQIDLVSSRNRSCQLPEWIVARGELDCLLATWEYRKSDTPWLVMKSKSASQRKATS
jgi:SAM-dependent methyltransferase